MQSLNEELITVNTQLDRKIIELAKASAALHNLFECNDIVTIFLVCGGRVRHKGRIQEWWRLV